MNEREAEGNKYSEQLYTDLVSFYYGRKTFDIRHSLIKVENLTHKFLINSKKLVNSDVAIRFHLQSFDLILEVLDHMMDWSHSFAKQKIKRKCFKNSASLRSKPWKKKYEKHQNLNFTTSSTVSYLREVARLIEHSNYNSTFMYHFLSLFAIRLALLDWLIYDSKRTHQIFLSTLSNEIFQRNSSDYSSLSQLLKEIQTSTCIVCMEELSNREFCIRDSCKHLMCKKCTLTLMEKQHDA